MKRPPSLTLRLTLLFSAAAAVVFFSFGWIIEHSIEHHFKVEDRAELEVIAETVVQALANHHVTDDSAALKQRLSDILVGHHGAALYIGKQDGSTLFTSPGSPDLSAFFRHHGTADNANGLTRLWSSRRSTYRILSRHLANDSATGNGAYTISVAVAIDHHLRFLDGFRGTLWLMVVIGIVATGLMGWIAVRQGHAPLRNIVAQIRSLSANELNTRLPPESMPRELTDLAVSFNEMVARMDEAFQRLANFSADIAHELRTPVTNLLTQTQVALSQRRTADEYCEILYSSIEEYERMAQMIADMLFLAKADNGLYQLNAAKINLTGEIQNLFEYYDAWAEERRVSLTLEGKATTSGDRLMLRRALSNLLSNAIRHTSRGQTVRVFLEHLTNQSTIITVENPGPTIPQTHLTKLFDRFYRVDSSRQRGGAGLGLAIVKSIVQIHGGKISASSTGGLTRFQITLPQSPGEALA